MGRNLVLKMPQVREAARLYRIGLSRRQVAAHFDVSERAVTNALRVAGEPLRERAFAAHLALSKDPHKHLAGFGLAHREANPALGQQIEKTARPHSPRPSQPKRYQ